MSRHPPDAIGITRARLHGRACYHVVNHTPHDEAVAELVEIATERRRRQKPRVRCDLLSEVAGDHLGAFQADPVVGWMGERAWPLIVAAGGTDERLLQETAADVRRRLSSGR